MSENNIVLSTDDKVAMSLVAAIKAEVNGLPKWGRYVDTHNVTRDNVKDHAFALAVLSYPNEKQVQTVKDAEGKKVRTKFGNAVQAAGNGLRRALADDDDTSKKTPDWLALVRQAAKNAADKGEINPTEIVAAVHAALAFDEDGEAAA